jgi:predicted phage tail protein
MDNSTALGTLAVLRQLENQGGMNIKFEYALVMNINRLSKINDVLQQLISRPIDGQELWEKVRKQIAEDYSEKDKNGNPVTQPSASGGTEYVIEDMDAFQTQLDKAKEKYQDILETVENRSREVKKMLDSEADFEPYTVHVKYLPMNKGETTLTVAQLRAIMPFLEGDINELRDGV